jgi:hypothetical protein
VGFAFAGGVLWPCGYRLFEVQSLIFLVWWREDGGACGDFVGGDFLVCMVLLYKSVDL